MSAGIGQLVAIAIMMALFGLLLYFFEERRPLLKYLFIMGILVSAFFVPSAVYNLSTTCNTVINTTTVVNNVTSYTYISQCTTDTQTGTADTFYKVMWSIYQLIILYFILRMFYELVHPLWERLRRW